MANTVDRLNGVIFMARFCGRRMYRGDYHDLLILHHQEPLIRELSTVRLSSFVRKLDEHENCLFVDLNIGTPLGAYWMQIVGVNQISGHRILNVVCLRSIPDHLFDENASTGKGQSLNDLDIDEFVENIKRVPKIIMESLNARGILNIFRFILVFMVTIVIGSFRFVIFLGDFTLKLVAEFSTLIDRLTPVFLAFLDLCGKAVGGSYILLAMLLRTGRSNDQQNVYRPSIDYSTSENRRSTRNIPVDHID